MFVFAFIIIFRAQVGNWCVCRSIALNASATNDNRFVVAVTRSTQPPDSANTADPCSAPGPPPALAPAPAPSATPTPPTAADPSKTAAAAPSKPTPKAVAPAGGAAAADASSLFQKVLIKVARVSSVEVVENSSKLYRLQIELGNGETRQVCAGMQPFIPQEELQGRMVCAVCNLKPAKLAGNMSEAMLLAAEAVEGPPAGEGDEAGAGLRVRLLSPPPGSSPGDQVYLQGAQPSLDTPKQVKSEHFKAVVAVLKVADNHLASLDGVPLVTTLGPVTVAEDIPPGSAIH
ncbi:hypothetical protein QJQ45_025514 [Haematococcus lacustris]|nr:hypothetical protein QJQ45_025514 [Haematococcus lacustris]